MTDKVLSSAEMQKLVDHVLAIDFNYGNEYCNRCKTADHCPCRYEAAKAILPIVSYVRSLEKKSAWAEKAREVLQPFADNQTCLDDHCTNKVCKVNEVLSSFPEQS